VGTAIIEYDDFTGGHFVGPRDTAQPANTWTGDNVWVDRSTGYLMPMARVTRLTSDTYTNTPPSSNSTTYPVRGNSGEVLWAQFDDATHWRWFARDWAAFGTDWTDGTVTSSAQFAIASGSPDAVPAFAYLSGAPQYFIGNGATTLQRVNFATMVTAATALTAIVATSNRENGAGSRPFSCLASQLRVKLGTTRPPTIEINKITAAMPIRMP